MKRIVLIVYFTVVYILLNAATITIKEFEHQIWQLTNRERAKENLPPLLYDEGLADLARLHSRNMLNYGFFAHKDHLGDMVCDRKNKYYPQLIVSSIGENLARFFNSAKVYTPAEIVEGWMNSPGHRENIMNKDFTYLGVGVINYGDRLIATQNFATPIVKLLSPLENKYHRKKTYTLEFQYMSPLPFKELSCILKFPNPKIEYKINEKYYSIGSKPLDITWVNEKALQVKLDFAKCTGTHIITFGFSNGYYDEGIKIRVKS